MKGETFTTRRCPECGVEVIQNSPYTEVHAEYHDDRRTILAAISDGTVVLRIDGRRRALVAGLASIPYREGDDPEIDEAIDAALRARQ